MQIQKARKQCLSKMYAAEADWVTSETANSFQGSKITTVLLITS